jgi:hypothetical protein
MVRPLSSLAKFSFVISNIRFPLQQVGWIAAIIFGGIAGWLAE